MAKRARKEATFEETLEKLEETAERLERGEMPLDESIKQYEEGVRAYRHCSQLLKEVERKIELLTKEGEGLRSEEAGDLDPLG